MWDQFDGKPYTREQFAKMVDAIPTEKLRWVKFLTCHNTATPTIAQWMGSVPAQQRIINLQSYYEHSLGWGCGPHGFIPPSRDICMWGFTPLTARGIHASCFNQLSIGLEMVGDFEREDFNSGNGALVRDNIVYVLAVLYRKLGLRPDGYVYGRSGLHLHRDCKRDNHACPGKTVNRDALVKAVLAEMDRLAPKPPPPANVPVALMDEMPPAKVAAAASPVGSGMFTKIASATAGAATINELADQGSRLGNFIKSVKQAFWRTTGTAAVVGGGASTMVDTNKGNAGTISEWAAAHPVALGCIVGGGIGLLVGSVILYIVIKRCEKWLRTAYADGRYTPREETA